MLHIHAVLPCNFSLHLSINSKTVEPSFQLLKRTETSFFSCEPHEKGISQDLVLGQLVLLNLGHEIRLMLLLYLTACSPCVDTTVCVNS